MKTESMYAVTEWIRSDTESCRSDVARLGLDCATEYNMDLIADRAFCDDHRWDAATEHDMRTALAALEANPNAGVAQAYPGGRWTAKG